LSGGDKDTSSEEVWKWLLTVLPNTAYSSGKGNFGTHCSLPPDQVGKAMKELEEFDHPNSRFLEYWMNNHTLTSMLRAGIAKRRLHDVLSFEGGRLVSWPTPSTTQLVEA